MARLRTFPIAALLAAIWATAATAQTFLPQGPSPSVGPSSIIQSRDAPPNGTTSGAVQSIATHPTNANVMYIGGVNGGVWSTSNGGATWTPLSDNQRSLSIASLGLDPTDSTSKSLIAGVGLTSNGFVGGDGTVASRGGERIGILYSTNGGTTWVDPTGNSTLKDKSIVGVAMRGDTILAAAAEPQDAAASGGLFMSSNKGVSFQAVSLGTGGAPQAVTALAADPGSQSTFYAAVNSTNAGDRGIYMTSNTGGAWTKLAGVTLASGQIARLATGPGGSVAAGIYDGTGKLVSLRLSKDSGANWTSLAVPVVNGGGQAATNLAIAIDRGNANIVYVAGDRPPDGETVTAFRVVLNGNSSSIETLTGTGTSDGSTTHADARNFAFDASGRLILVGDGGIYVRTNPQGSNGTWTGLNSSALQLREAYAVVYDAVSKRLVVAAQDTGTAYQANPGSSTYNAIGEGDGVNAVVNDRTNSGRSAIYTSAQSLGPLVRRTVDPQGTTLSSTTFETTKDRPGVLNFEADDFTEKDDEGNLTLLPFSSRVVLNRKDPTKIAFGTNYIYTTTDAAAASSTLDLTNLGVAGSPIGPISALAYGANDNANALVAGSANGLYLSTTGAANSLGRLGGYTGGTPSSIVFDGRTGARFFVADTAKLWGTTNTGTGFTDLTANLTNNTISLNVIRPTSVEFISNNGVNALLVGGLNAAASAPAGSPVAVADSSAGGVLSNWRPFGAGLPNTIVNQLNYNPTADVLAVGLFGRGAWLLYDVTTYFSTATALKFGAADNDSSPAASLLAGARNLEKVGAGTLTITGTPTYSGTTIIRGGRLAANGSLTSSSGVTVEAGGTLGGTGTVPSTTVNGTLAPGNSIGTITVSGNLTLNPGSTYQVEVAGAANDRTNVSGTATLAGTTQATYTGTTFTRAPNTILSAAGGRTGTFQNLTTSGLPSFLFGRLGYGTTDVTISLQSGMASIPGLGGNQGAVARAFDTAFNAGAGLNGMPALYGLSAGQIPQALSMLSGDSASVAQSAALSAGGQFATILTDRAGTRRAEELACRDQPTDAADACGGTPPDWSAWAAAFGGTQWLNAYAPTGSAASQQNVSGGAFGGDYRAGPDTLVGVAVGYSGLNVSMPANGASGQASGIHVGVYGQHGWRSFYLNASMAFSRFDGSMTRSISGIGTPETAKSLTVSTELAGRLEIGHPFEVGKAGVGQFELTPFAALQPAQFWQPGTTETSTTGSGAPGAFALTYQPQSTTSLPTFLGTQLDGRTEVNGLPLKGWLRLAWVHEFMPNRPVTAGFVNLPGNFFTVDGAQAASDAVRIDFGARYSVGSQTSLFANAAAELSDRGRGYSGTIGLRLSW